MQLNGVNGGGLHCDSEHTLQLQFSALCHAGLPTVAESPTKFLIGDIPAEGMRGVDGILSFGWLARRRILVDTYEHGLVIPPNWDQTNLFRLESHFPASKGFKIAGIPRGDHWDTPTPIQVEMKRRREAWDVSYTIPFPTHPNPGQAQKLIRPLLEVDEFGRVTEPNPVCPLPNCPYAPHKTQMKKLNPDGLLISVLPKIALDKLIQREPEKWRTHCEKKCECPRYGFTWYAKNGRTFGIYNIDPQYAYNGRKIEVGDTHYIDPPLFPVDEPEETPWYPAFDPQVATSSNQSPARFDWGELHASLRRVLARVDTATPSAPPPPVPPPAPLCCLVKMCKKL